MKSILPPGVLTQHVIALGKTGAGKSSAMRVLVEGLLDEGQAADDHLIQKATALAKSNPPADGKRPGYPVVIFGGEHADVPRSTRAPAPRWPSSSPPVTDRASSISAAGWSANARGSSLTSRRRCFGRPRACGISSSTRSTTSRRKGKIIDPDAGKMLHWANRLASEGAGARSITIIAASQRPQKVHNDFLTSCETLIAMRVIHKADRDAIKDWIDGCADAATGREVLATLAAMKRGEAWVWSPEIDFGPTRITFPLFKTYDSFKPQGADTAKLTGWADVDLDEVRSKLAAVVQEAEANDPGQAEGADRGARARGEDVRYAGHRIPGGACGRCAAGCRSRPWARCARRGRSWSRRSRT